MADEVVLGTNAFILIRTERIRVVGQGTRRVQTWSGPQALMQEKENELYNAGASQVRSTSGVPGIVAAEYEDEADAEVETIWELNPVSLDKPLATHPAFNESGSSLAIIEIIEEAVRKGTAADLDVDGYGFPNLVDYRNLRLKGVESYRVWTFTISKTIRSIKEGLIEAEFTNVQKVVRYVDIGLPTWVKWNTPKIRLWNGGTAIERNINEWLVGPPTVRYEGLKYTLTQEWIGAESWYAILYEGATGKTTDEGAF